MGARSPFQNTRLCARVTRSSAGSRVIPRPCERAVGFGVTPQRRVAEAELVDRGRTARIEQGCFLETGDHLGRVSLATCDRGEHAWHVGAVGNALACQMEFLCRACIVALCPIEIQRERASVLRPDRAAARAVDGRSRMSAALRCDPARRNTGACARAPVRSRPANFGSVSSAR